MTESLAELKTTQEEQADLVRRYVDEYAALALEADRIKQRMDWLSLHLPRGKYKAFFQRCLPQKP